MQLGPKFVLVAVDMTTIPTRILLAQPRWSQLWVCVDAQEPIGYI